MYSSDRSMVLLRMQNLSKIKIEAKPTDPQKGYSFELIKTQSEVKIYYKKIDSIAKFSVSDQDMATMKRLLGSANAYFDTLTRDSLSYYQQKIDSIKTANTYYKIDSATVYNATHSTYWRLLETILNTPNNVLNKKNTEINATDETYCFFTFLQNNQERPCISNSLEPKQYPLLVKLINDTKDIMKAHKLVMERKNQ